MAGLTKPQLRAIDSMRSHNVQIIACAGSGKTEVISRGIAEIVRRGAAPSTIVAFTFTEKAAEELKARIRYILKEMVPGTSGLGDMYAGTIHSYCFEALKELRPEYRSYDVLDEAARVAYLSKPFNYYNRLNLVGLEKAYGLTKFVTVTRFIGAVEVFLNEGISASRLTKIDPRMAEAIDAYRAALAEDRYLDFSTMIHELVTLLETDRTARRDFQAKVRYVVVDEYQDVNGLQERLIRAMAGRDTRVTVVGDDDQSIYGWRGAVVDYIKNFPKAFPNVKTVTLQDNFRSTAGIVSLANGYIAHNRSRLVKKMIARGRMGHQGTDIQYSHFETEDDQARFITRRIRELVGSDFTGKDGKQFALGLGDVGILVRSNADVERLLPFLVQAGIDYVVDSGESVFDQVIVLGVLDIFDWVFGLPTQPLDTMVGLYLSNLRDGTRTVPAKAEILRRIRAMKRRLDAIARKGNRDYLPDLGLQGLFHELLGELGIPQTVLTDAEHFYLASLSLAVSDYEKVWQRLRHSEYKYFRGFVTAWAQYSYAVPGTQIGGITGRVKVMTIHKAKGLEFPVVFIPYLNRKRKPNPRASFIPAKLFNSARYDGTEEDDRRVYYVAVTRSQKYLFLSGMEQDNTVQKPREPAVMVAELDPKLLSAPKVLRPPRSGLAERKPDHAFATTFSELTAYGRCGYDYKLRYFFGYNAGVPAAFGYGTQIHNILNLIHTRYRDKTLSDRHVKKLVDKHFYLRYAPGAMSKNAKKAAVRVVQNYVRNHSHEFPTILETEKSFEAAIGDTLIDGQIDLIKRLDANGRVQEVEVVDFKSDNALLYKPDSQHQVRLYVAASRDALNLDPKKATIQDLETGKKEDVQIGPPEMQETLKVLGGRIDGIRAGKFVPVKSKQVCPECDYRRICPHAVK
ncbi:MAG: ATP-dependent DNA helicase [Sulfuricaulis sp.]|uniref:ATP-dependent helicase n=1 Tax=Sulfuricaulis sp. TaxID=2003553 RepID=UPI0034A38DEC